MSKQAPRRALIVIDVQNGYITGNFRIEYPPVASSLPNIAKAIDAANASGVPVVLVKRVLPADAPICVMHTVLFRDISPLQKCESKVQVDA